MQNFLHILLITLSLSSLLISSIASADATPIFFMKANSSAQINMEFTFSSGTWNFSPLVYRIPYDNISGPTNSITVDAEPWYLHVTSHQKYNVNYTITPRNNVTGTFEIGVAGTCGSYLPVVVGLNKSEVDPKIFASFGNGDQFGCQQLTPDTENIVGYSGIIPIAFSENFTSSVPLDSSLQIPEFPFAIPILLISIISLIIFYRIDIINRNG